MWKCKIWKLCMWNMKMWNKLRFALWNIHILTHVKFVHAHHVCNKKTLHLHCSPVPDCASLWAAHFWDAWSSPSAQPANPQARAGGHLARGTGCARRPSRARDASGADTSGTQGCDTTRNTQSPHRAAGPRGTRSLAAASACKCKRCDLGAKRCNLDVNRTFAFAVTAWSSRRQWDDTHSSHKLFLQSLQKFAIALLQPVVVVVIGL